jgi:F-type H+-transporting ATPase subunit b
MVLALTMSALASSGEAHHADSGVLLKDFLYRLFSFAITFGLLAYFLAKPIRLGLSGRREGIEKTLRQAEDARKEAEAKFAEYDSKLARAAGEIEQIYGEIRREGELERQKIVANAQEMAAKIRQEAERTAANEIAKARTELRQEAAQMAVRIAEDILRQKVTAQDQDRLVDEYMQKVGELH